MELPDKRKYKYVNKQTFHLTAVSLLLALSIALSLFESFLPVSNVLMPGMKLGLSNIAVMFALGSLGLVPALIISIVKSLFILSLKGPVAFLLSLSGAMLSIVIMKILLCVKKVRLGYIFISIIGAISHNFAQMAVASFMVGQAVFYYLPVLLIFAVFSGILTGVCLNFILPYLSKLLL